MDETKHGGEGSAGQREVTIGCLVEVEAETEEREMGVRFAAGFEASLGRTMLGLSGTDVVVVEVELAGGRRPSRKQLERLLSRVYVLAEHHKKVRDQLLVQVVLRIQGFSAVHRAHSTLFSHTPPNDDPVHTLALGGTFDHLHSGHKILLTLAAWLASHRLIVGITDDALLVNKQHANRLQTLPERTQAVRAFLQRVGPLDLRLETPALNDVYGPTAHDPLIDALLVSKETLPGAHAIHTIRAQNSLPPLKLFVVDVISNCLPSLPVDSHLMALKISSTNIRAWIESHSSSSPSN